MSFEEWLGGTGGIRVAGFDEGVSGGGGEGGGHSEQ